MQQILSLSEAIQKAIIMFSMLWYISRTQSQNTTGEMNWIFIINNDHVLKNNLSRFLSQKWEIVLDAWDRHL